MSTLKIELDGVLVTGRIGGVEQFKVTLRSADMDGSLVKSFSSELTFYDDGYQTLHAALIADPFGFSKSVTVKVFDDCCSEPVFVGLIRGDSIDWCESECSISANLVEDTPALNCIKSTLIWDNWNGFLGRQFFPVRYCIETRPEFIQYVLLYLAFILNTLVFAVVIPTIAIVVAITVVIFAICNVISLICSIPLIGCNPPNCDTPFTNPAVAINTIIAAFQEINEQIIPCGRFHPSPYVREYIQNVCDKCGLAFQSSILNNPSSIYYNTLMVAAQIKKGRKKNSTDFTLIGDNKPVETLETLFLNYLNVLFNAEHRIVNNVLIFERKDFFNTLSTWIDVDQIIAAGDMDEKKVCFSWIDKERWAFGRYEYPPDAMDYMGNEARDRWNDIVDWNVPYNPAQSGQKIVTPAAGAARFRRDDIDTDVFTHFQSALGGVINAYFFGAFNAYDRAMLINQHTFFNYKFLIAKQGSDGIIEHEYDDAFTGGNVGINPVNRFNYPFWFREGYDNNLYSVFHYIDDPRLPGSTNYNFNFMFRFTCDQLLDFDFSKNIKLIRGGVPVLGKPMEIEIDFVNRSMNVRGIV